jgi:hypothetical protein
MKHKAKEFVQSAGLPGPQKENMAGEIPLFGNTVGRISLKLPVCATKTGWYRV